MDQTAIFDGNTESENSSYSAYQWRGIAEYGESYIFEECYPEVEEVSECPATVKGWRKTPRSPSDFSESSSSLDDDEYNAWLENYNRDLENEKLKKSCEDKAVGTNEEQDELKKFASHEEKRKESTDYWSLKHKRRHWAFNHKLKSYLFPSQYPQLNVTSRYGRYHFQWHAGSSPNELSYRKPVGPALLKSLEDLNRKGLQIRKFVFSDTLVCLSTLDAIMKTWVLRSMCQFFQKQRHLEIVCFENSRLERIEGVALLSALCQNNANALRELHIWKMFKCGHNPSLTDCMSIQGRRSTRKYPRIRTEAVFFQIMSMFSFLTHLSINYAYLANEQGNVLLHMKSIREGRLRELRLLCLEEERPFRSDPRLGAGGWIIHDGVWKKVRELCPDLRVMFVFINLPNYEEIILFLSKSIPVKFVYISSGVGLRFQSPWDVDSTLLTLKQWYGSTLETLSLHLWRHRDLLDYVIKSKILVEFPELICFEFIGILNDINILDEFCNDLSSGKYKLKKLLFWVEEVYSNDERKSSKLKVEEIDRKYRRRFQYLGIYADLRTYPA